MIIDIGFLIQLKCGVSFLLWEHHVSSHCQIFVERISARQLILVHISALAYVRTWCHALGMSLVTLNFLGVTLRNIVGHGNFRK